MRGSVLLTFNETIDDLGLDAITINVAGQERYIRYIDSNRIYTTPINTGEIGQITLLATSYTESSSNITIKRIDYTTDDVDGDNGIKETLIDSFYVTSGDTTFTFTATTRPDAYGFRYVIDVNKCFNSGTGFTYTFLTGQTGSTRVREVKVFDEKIYIGGRFNYYNNNLYSGMTILNSNGTVYSGFSYNNFGDAANRDYQGITSIEVLSNGKMYVGGSFINYSGVTAYSLVKLNSDGTLDTSFTVGPNYNEAVLDIEVQSDGKVMVLGSFSQFSGTSRNGILRLNTNGTLDTSFNPGTGISPLSSSEPIDMTIQSDGKIIVVGNFTSYNGNSRNRIVRINTDGSIDSSFSIGTGLNAAAYSVEVQSDGKILVCGDFSTYNGITRNGIVRLNSDGSIDTSFTSPFSSSSVNCYDNEILSNGKILVATNVSVGSLYRLNSDGSFDTSFNNPIYNSTETFSVETIAVNTNNEIYVGGAFTIFDGFSMGRFVKLDENGNLLNCVQ